MEDKCWDSSLRTRTCLDSVSVSNPINVFQDTPSTTAMPNLMATANATASTTTNTTSLHTMGLRLSSQSPPQSLDWNQALRRGDQKSENSFQNLLQDQDHSLRPNTTNFQLESNQWRSDKMYASSSQDSSSDFKQFNAHGFHLEQPMQVSNNESIITCQGLNSSFQNMDLYGSPSTMMQNLFGSDSNQQDSSFDQNQGMNYSMYQSSYHDMNTHGGSGSVGGGIGEGITVNSSKKVQLAEMGANQLHFSNNTRFWNVAETGVSNIRITSRVTKERITEPSTKRPRNNHLSPLPSFKVKKEKMGDRITALQQLVSPFGKTDTASVLSEAIEYIKFLHEQVTVLSIPYMKNGLSTIQHQPQKIQQISEKSSDGPRHNLSRRGLCLVPVSSTFPLTQETTADLWTPTFGGTFR